MRNPSPKRKRAGFSGNDDICANTRALALGVLMAVTTTLENLSRRRRASHFRRAMIARVPLIPLAATAGVLLLVIVLTILIAGRLRQQSAVIDQQTQAIEALSRRLVTLETSQTK